MKQFLARFLPASARAFHGISGKQGEILERILKLLKMQNQKIDEMSKNIDELQKKSYYEKFCPVCEKSVKFVAFTKGKAANRCPYCKSHDRTRILALYLEKETLLFSPKQKNIVKLLHFAPEKGLLQRFKNISHIDYFPVDFNASRYRNLRDTVDIQAIQYEDNMFDVIIVNHVLEHIPNDLLAMQELLRVLKVGGFAYRTVPMFENLPKTLENPSYNTPELRQKYYGQHDHIRKYGIDFPQRLENSGFNVEIVLIEEYLTKYESQLYGVSNRVKLFKCSKK
ncbi:MAG: class I SAM-dependent methyltransferase [Firmicutes bacterium]|nr:class I SAM-dependent methyltransferase [Bacillota bacterium]